MLFSTWLRYWKHSLENRSSRKQTRRQRPPIRRVAPRPRLEVLEDRTLLSAYVVTTTADSGPGSLRDAITQVNADASHALYASPSNPNVDEIDFNITAASDAAGGGTGYNATTGVATIQPQSALPNITNAVIINGYSQPGATPNTLSVGDNAVLKIDLDGSQSGLVSGLNVAGLYIDSNSTVEGLAVTNFGNGQQGFTAPEAILVGGSNNQITGDFIGTDVTGTVEEGNGMGVVVYGSGNTIGGTCPAMRNVIGGNADFGVWLRTDGNVVEGNYIGTDHTGTKAFGNPVGVEDDGSNNTIGGSVSGAGNVISGNGSFGIRTGNSISVVIQDNFIGTDATGTLGLGNGLTGPQGFLVGDGINISGGASATIVGNLISANPYGLVFSGNASDMVVQGNLIGTDATGTTTTGTDGNSLGNIYEGIDAGGPATIGGTTAAARNVISGNGTGIDVQGRGVVIQGNYIGTDITGTHALGNDGSPSNYGEDAGGIELFGTGTTVVGNLISGNGLAIDIRPAAEAGEDGSGTVIQGNLIGTDYTGTQPLGNAVGILFQGGGSNYTIGGTTAEAGNVISGNGYGISMGNDGPPVATGDVIEGNFIGTNAAGATNVGNGTGVYIEGTFSGTEIGGTTAAAANVIADNGGSGIYFYGSSGNVIQGNSIIGNGGDGVHLQGSSNTMVGGTMLGAGNTISFNKGDGILLAVFPGTDPAGLGNSFLGNSIHDNAAGIGVQSNENNANPNSYPAAPVLTTATGSATNTTISGTLASVANTTFRIEFFSNADLDASGTTAEGLTYLGFTTVTTDGNGNATFAATNLAAIPVGQGYLTATATNQSIGDTSEFSNYLTAPTSTVLTSSANPSLLNQSVTFTATVYSSFGTPTGSVDFVDTTTGTDLGTVALSSNATASITEPSLTLGAHVIEAIYAGQGSFLGSSGTLTQQVSYNFSGFLPPLGNGLTFAANRTIPVQFQLTDANGNAINSLSAVTSLQIQALDANGNPVGAPFNPVSTNKQGLQYSGGQYQFNWQTKGLAAGSYQIVLKLADGTTHTQTIQLTANGNGANAQATDGSDVGDGSTAGQLLGGDVELYVDNSNGDLTPDELARIQDAVNAVDAVIAPYGVAINEVTDPTQANVTLSMGTNSAVGGYGQGILGCYTTTGTITLIQGWNWYAGADPMQIGASQYDFQTTVTHELGHALGLGESSVTTSAMYGTLSPGTTIRTLTTADLNIPYDEGSADAQRAAVPPVSGPVSRPSNGPVTTAPSNPSVPSSGSPLSVADQLLVDLAVVMSDVRNAYQSEVTSMSALWRSADALAMQRLDTLLSMQAGAMGMAKDMLMRDLFFVGLSSSNAM